MDSWSWQEVIAALTPTVAITALFFFVLKVVINADRNERRAQAEWEVDHGQDAAPSLEPTSPASSTQGTQGADTPGAAAARSDDEVTIDLRETTAAPEPEIARQPEVEDGLIELERIYEVDESAAEPDSSLSKSEANNSDIPEQTSDSAEKSATQKPEKTDEPVVTQNEHSVTKSDDKSTNIGQQKDQFTGTFAERRAARIAARKRREAAERADDAD